MPEVLVGINLPQDNPDPDYLRRTLEGFARDGFNAVEISLDTWPLIIDGEIRPQYVSFLGEMLKDFPFRYSAHVGRGLDLRDKGSAPLHQLVLQASIEICGRLGLNPLVLHYDKKSTETAVEERFLEVHRQAAERAQEAGVLLCLENIEVDPFAHVLQCVRRAAHPNLKLAFDTGHAFLAAGLFGFDFLEALQSCLDVLGHVHLSDNTGRFEPSRISDRLAYDTLPMGKRYTFGQGDVHAPPFWGKIPFAPVFKLLREYRGLFICECYSWWFVPFLRKVQENVRAGIAAARAL